MGKKRAKGEQICVLWRGGIQGGREEFSLGPAPHKKLGRGAERKSRNVNWKQTEKVFPPKRKCSRRSTVSGREAKKKRDITKTNQEGITKKTKLTQVRSAEERGKSHAYSLLDNPKDAREKREAT